MNKRRPRPESIKILQTEIPSDVKFEFTQRVKFYDLTIQEVLFTMVQAFNKGELDHIFNIPQD